MKKALILLCILAALAGCATAPVGRKYSQTADGLAVIPAGMSALYFYQPSGFYSQLSISINGVDNFLLGGGTFQPYFVQEGKTFVSFLDQSLVMDLQAGKRYYVKAYQTSTYLFLFTVTQNHLEEVLPAIAEKELAACTAAIVLNTKDKPAK
jgi:hypothetical protein